MEIVHRDGVTSGSTERFRSRSREGRVDLAQTGRRLTSKGGLSGKTDNSGAINPLLIKRLCGCCR
jgi:hypothetical protein